MNLMDNPDFLITKYFNTDNSIVSKTIDEIKKELYALGIMMKYYEESSLILVYHKYDMPVKSDLQRETRSLIIDSKTYKVLAYTGEVPFVNKEGLQLAISQQYCSYGDATESYEGTLLTLFNHNNKWNLSTRRCLDSKDSKFNSEKSHFQLFEEVLCAAGYGSYDHFTSQLDINFSYYFVLIHHEGKNIIDYTYKFGENYKVVCLISIKDENQVEMTDYRTSLKFYNNNIIMPTVVSFNDFDAINKNVDYTKYPQTEGVIIKAYNLKMKKYNIVKLQTLLYQFYNATNNESNMLKGLLYLYQADQLSNYLPKNADYAKLINMQNTCESYDMIGAIDSVFKVCSSELFELFKMLWNIKTGSHQNKDLYDAIPKEYKDILFKIRGIYKKKKSDYTRNKHTNPELNYLNSHIKINDIYNLLKNIDIDELYALIRVRKVMFMQDKISNNMLNSVSNRSDKIHLKLCAIFSHKLFPNVSNIPL